MDAVRWSTLLADWRTHQGALYLRLSAAFQGVIRGGKLAPAEQLPAERSLAELLGVSRSTVVAAYDTLAAMGVTTAVPGSGTSRSSAGSLPAGSTETDASPCGRLTARS